MRRLALIVHHREGVGPAGLVAHAVHVRVRLLADPPRDRQAEPAIGSQPRAWRVNPAVRDRAKARRQADVRQRNGDAVPIVERGDDVADDGLDEPAPAAQLLLQRLQIAAPRRRQQPRR